MALLLSHIRSVNAIVSLTGLQIAVILHLLWAAGRGDWDTDNVLVKPHYSIRPAELASGRLLLSPSVCVLRKHSYTLGLEWYLSFLWWGQWPKWSHYLFFNRNTRNSNKERKRVLGSHFHHMDYITLFLLNLFYFQYLLNKLFSSETI